MPAIFLADLQGRLVNLPHVLVSREHADGREPVARTGLSAPVGNELPNLCLQHGDSLFEAALISLPHSSCLFAEVGQDFRESPAASRSLATIQLVFADLRKMHGCPMPNAHRVR